MARADAFIASAAPPAAPAARPPTRRPPAVVAAVERDHRPQRQCRRQRHHRLGAEEVGVLDREDDGGHDDGGGESGDPSRQPAAGQRDHDDGRALGQHAEQPADEVDLVRVVEAGEPVVVQQRDADAIEGMDDERRRLVAIGGSVVEPAGDAAGEGEVEGAVDEGVRDPVRVGRGPLAVEPVERWAEDAAVAQRRVGGLERRRREGPVPLVGVEVLALVEVEVPRRGARSRRARRR